MKKSSFSMLVFAVYLAALSLAFLFFPNPFITLFGFEETSEVWIRILGYLLGVLSFYFFMAVSENSVTFYRWSVYGRLPTLPFFLSLIYLDLAPSVLPLFGLVDTICAVWTALALKYERTHQA